MLTVNHLNKTYPFGLFNRHTLKPVNDVSINIQQGTTLGLMGNSGCGKTTLSRIIMRLISYDSGEIIFDGKDISKLKNSQMRSLRQQMQLIFQHPEASLNPLKKVQDSLREPLLIHHLYEKEQREEIIHQKLKLVGLPEAILSRYPHEISGGEAQRVIIARALTMDVKFFILDEPTSMLDVSVQAQIMNLFANLQKQLNLTYLFISHDLEVVKWISRDIAFMHQGRIVEQGCTNEILENPQQPFTQTFLRCFHD